jgi:hypothetical protein
LLARVVPTPVHALDTVDKLVEPGRKSQSRLADLQLDNWNTAQGVAICRQICGVIDLAVDIITRPSIAFASPARCTVDGCQRVAACKPHVWSAVELVFSDAGHEAFEEGSNGEVRERLGDVRCSIGNKPVPDLFN